MLDIAMHSELTVKTARELTSGVSTANTFWTTVREFAISAVTLAMPSPVVIRKLVQWRPLQRLLYMAVVRK
jgi:hypothetical protein